MFVGATTATLLNFADFSITVDIPDGVEEGDLLVALIATGSYNLTSSPTGWTGHEEVVLHDTGSGAFKKTHRIYKVATDSEPGSYTFSFSASSNFTGVILSAWRGVDTSDPFHATEDATDSGQTVSTPDIDVSDPPVLRLHYRQSRGINGENVSIGDADGATAVADGLSGLSAGTTYRWRLFVEDSVDQTTGVKSGVETTAQTAPTHNNLLQFSLRKEIPEVDAEFIGTTLNTSNTTSYTFSNVSIGDAAEDRLVVVVAHSESTSFTSPREATSCTIGGVAATRAVHVVSPSPTAIFYRVVPTGTTATIVVNYDDGMGRCLIGRWRVTGYDSTTPVSTDTDLSSTGTGLSVSVDIPAGGAAVCGQTNGTQNTTVSWSGATVRHNSAPQNLTHVSGADVQPTRSERNNHSITTSHSNSTQPITLVSASWAPHTDESPEEKFSTSTIDIESSISGEASKGVSSETELSTELVLSAGAMKHGIANASVSLDLDVSGDVEKSGLTATAVGVDLDSSGTSTKTGVTDTEIEISLGSQGSTAKTGLASTGMGVILASAGSSEKHGVASTDAHLEMSADGEAEKGASSDATLPLSLFISVTSDALEQRSATTAIGVGLDLIGASQKASESSSALSLTLDNSGDAEKRSESESALSVGLALVVTSGAFETRSASGSLGLTAALSGDVESSRSAQTSVPIHTALAALDNKRVSGTSQLTVQVFVEGEADTGFVSFSTSQLGLQPEHEETGLWAEPHPHSLITEKSDWSLIYEHQAT